MIDSSVVVKWFVDEDGFELARTLIDVKSERISPELMLAETANVLQRKMRIGELQGSQAADAIRNLPYFFDDLVSSKMLVNHAFALSRALDHSVYDCMYLALALGETDAKLVTNDTKFLGKAKAAGLGEKIWDLSVAARALATGQENENG